MKAGRTAGVRGDSEAKKALWGTLVTLFVSGVVALYSLNRGVEPSIGVVLSLLTLALGLLALLLVLHYDQIARTEQAVDKAQEQADLWRKLEQAPWMREYMKNIIDWAAAIDAMPDNKVFVDRVTEMLEEWQDGIREIAEGRIRVNPDRFGSVVMPLVKMAVDGLVEGGVIRAVSVWNPSSDHTWWYTPAGKEYWALNQRALKSDKPVSIERIFVYTLDSRGRMPHQLQDLIEEQCSESEHVHVYTVEASKIEAFLQLDMVVFDKSFEFEQRVSYLGEIQDYLGSTNSLDISRRVRQFESIRAKPETREFDCQDILARKETTAGHVALSGGDWQEAKRRYEQAGKHGFRELYVTFNLAMADVVADRGAAALERLNKRAPPDPGTPIEVNWTALKTICTIVADRDGTMVRSQFEELEDQKKSLDSFVFTQSPLRHLEYGLQTSRKTVPPHVISVFDTLKKPPSEKPASEEPT